MDKVRTVTGAGCDVICGCSASSVWSSNKGLEGDEEARNEMSGVVKGLQDTMRVQLQKMLPPMNPTREEKLCSVLTYNKKARSS